MAANFIDVHHHIIPEVYREGLKEFGIDKSGGMPLRAWTPEDSLELMEKNGIATAICSISEPAVYPILEKDKEKACALARRVNEFMAEMIRDYPGRFGAFALLPLPDVDSALREMEYAFDVLKLDGIGLLSNYRDEYLGNTLFNELFAELQKRKGAAYVHPSAPPANFVRPQFTPLDYVQEFTFCTARAATNLIASGTMQRCPDIKLFFSHMGGVFPYLRLRLTTTLAGARRNPRLPLNDEQRAALNSLEKPIYEYMAMYYYDTALSAHDVAFHAVETLDPTHICYGSDSFFAGPASTQYVAEGIMRQYAPDSAEYYAVARGNALKVFPRFKTSIEQDFPVEAFPVFH